ncbi:MAG: STAS domain-containing protein [Planctomycetota bacterium]
MDSPLAQVSQDGPRVTIDIERAEVDTDSLRDLIQELKQRLNDQNARKFVFGFEKVEFLPSACLALLLMFYQEVKRQEGRIVLLNCQENVSFLLRLARLDALFELAQGSAADI